MNPDRLRNQRILAWIRQRAFTEATVQADEVLEWAEQALGGGAPPRRNVVPLASRRAPDPFREASVVNEMMARAQRLDRLQRDGLEATRERLEREYRR